MINLIQKKVAVKATFQSVEKPGLCVKHKPGFWRIKAKKVQT